MTAFDAAWKRTQKALAKAERDRKNADKLAAKDMARKYIGPETERRV